MEDSTFEQQTIREMTTVSIAGNTLLAAFKLIAGFLGQSSAMISDAIHSLSDVLTTFIAWVGVSIAGRQADDSHPYGHERYECLASLFLGLVLVATGIGIGYEGVKTLATGAYLTTPTPKVIALIAAVVSIVVKEAMFRYVRKGARSIRSEAFEADAWHHRSDALSSVGALIGIGATRLGFPAGDCLASLVICLFILKASWDIIKGAIDNMLDTPCDPATEDSIRKDINAQPGVEGVDMLLTRKFGNRVYVDTEIAVEGSMTVSESHQIAERVHDMVESNYPEVKHVMVHVNPA